MCEGLLNIFAILRNEIHDTSVIRWLFVDFYVPAQLIERPHVGELFGLEIGVDSWE